MTDPSVMLAVRDGFAGNAPVEELGVFDSLSESETRGVAWVNGVMAGQLRRSVGCGSGWHSELKPAMGIG